MVILVFGCRNWGKFPGEVERLRTNMYIATAADDDNTLVHGGARGADTLAKDYAKELGWEIDPYPADWDGPAKKGAGFVRNQKMADRGGIDCGIAFWDGDSTGTLDMIKRATRAGIPVGIVPRRVRGAGK